MHAVLESVNEIDHGLLLLLLKLKIFLWVAEVSKSLTSPKLCHIEGPPLVRIHI